MNPKTKETTNRQVKSSAFTALFGDPRNAAALYRAGQIFIPTPEFYVFYNGTDPFPKEKILQLSDAYLVKTEEPMLQLKTKVININLQENHPLLKECRPMYEYSWLIQEIREGTGEGMSRDEAIITAIEAAKKQGILVDFLQEHGTEASNMLFTQFNMDDALRVRGEEKYEDGKADGRVEGKAEAILELLGLLGPIPDSCKEEILAEQDIPTLTSWLKLAAKANSIEAFLEKH